MEQLDENIKYNIIKYLPIEEQFLLGYNKIFINKMHNILNDMYCYIYNNNKNNYDKICIYFKELSKQEILYYLCNYDIIEYLIPRYGFYRDTYELTYIYKLYYEKQNDAFIIINYYENGDDHPSFYAGSKIIENNGINKKHKIICKFTRKYRKYTYMLGNNNNKIIYYEDKIFYLIDIKKIINYL